jgi:hypothetical protein
MIKTLLYGVLKTILDNYKVYNKSHRRAGATLDILLFVKENKEKFEKS